MGRKKDGKYKKVCKSQLEHREKLSHTCNVSPSGSRMGKRGRNKFEEKTAENFPILKKIHQAINSRSIMNTQNKKIQGIQHLLIFYRIIESKIQSEKCFKNGQRKRHIALKEQ